MTKNQYKLFLLNYSWNHHSELANNKLKSLFLSPYKHRCSCTSHKYFDGMTVKGFRVSFSTRPQLTVCHEAAGKKEAACEVFVECFSGPQESENRPADTDVSCGLHIPFQSGYHFSKLPTSTRSRVGFHISILHPCFSARPHHILQPPYESVDRKRTVEGLIVDT